MKTKLEVSLPGEPDRHFPIDTRAIIGKGPTADVSLDVPGIIAQHFRVKLGVNELLATIVMNAIAVLFTEYMVQFPLRADPGATAHSPIIDLTAQLPIFLPGSKWGLGFVIALIAVAAVYVYLWRSVPGYEQRMAGQSRNFALF